MHESAARAYERTAQTTVGPRELEARLLLKAAGRLQAARDASPFSEADFVAALRYNRKLWTVLLEAATRAGNPLPAGLKNNIGSLAVFIFNRSIALEADPAASGVGALININAQIAAGLRAG